MVHYLPLLVDDGHCILQLDIIEETGQENIGHADQAVVLLLVEEWVGALEIRAHHLGIEVCMLRSTREILTHIKISQKG